jgi:hypothetical protein
MCLVDLGEVLKDAVRDAIAAHRDVPAAGV